MSTAQTIKIGEWTAKPKQNLIERNGSSVRLSPRAMDTLVYLSEHRHEVVAIDELLATVWRGVVVGDSSIYSAINELRKALGDSRESPVYIETVPRRGYRLVATVEYPSGPSPSDGIPAQSGRAKRWPLWAGAAILAIAILAVNFEAGRLTARNDARNAAATSIAVLPFADHTEGGEQRWFAEGISQGVLEALSEIPALRVAGQRTVAMASGRQLGIADIADSLDVDYMLRGSVTVGVDELEVDLELLDVRAARRWSQHYAGAMSEVFTIQNEIVADVAERLNVDPRRSTPIVDETTQDVLELYMQAQYINGAGLWESLPRARELIEHAVELDPGYFPARCELMLTYLNSSVVYRESRETFLTLARKAVEDAAAIWPERTAGWRALVAFGLDNDLEAAASLLERAFREDSTNVDVSVGAFATRFAVALNRPAQAIDVGEYVVARNPVCVWCYGGLVRAYFLAKRYDDVQRVYRQARSLGFDDPEMRMNFGNVLLSTGDLEGALAEFEAMSLPPEAEDARLVAKAMVWHSMGRDAEFEAALTTLRSRSDPYLRVPQLLSYAGDLDGAFALLESQPALPMNLFDGRFGDAMRQHPRWPELARKAGIWPEDPRDKISFEIELPR